MIVLQIEHPVPNFEAWKKAFENDPVGREKGGVISYSIFRKTEDPNYVVIDLEFKNKEQATSFLDALKKLWGAVQGTVMNHPQARILEKIETKEY